MRKLLSAGFCRFLTHPLFLGILILLPIIFGALAGVDLRYGVDDFYLIPLLFGFGAVIALSWGREIGDGTVRNKVVAGHTKGKIFLAEALLHAGVCTVMMLLFLITMLIVGYPAAVRAPAAILLEVCGCLLLSTVSMSILISAVCSLISHRAIGAIVGILLVLGLMLGSYQMQNVLHQLPSYTVETINDDGTVTVEEVKNRHYVDGAMRPVCHAIDRSNPFSQMSYSISALGAYTYDRGEGYDEDPEWIAEKAERTKLLHTLPLFSLGFSAVAAAAGYGLFRRKNLK